MVLTLPSAPQTLDSLSCNGSEELEQLQLEMTDLRQEVRRLKVEPLLSADPLAGAFCWHSLVVWEAVRWPVLTEGSPLHQAGSHPLLSLPPAFSQAQTKAYNLKSMQLLFFFFFETEEVHLKL